MSKVKPNKNMLYTVKANVFATKLGSQFGTTVHTTVVANNNEEALEEAKKSFNTYIFRLRENHHNDFSYDNLAIE